MQARNLLVASYLSAFVMWSDTCVSQFHFANSSLLAMQQKRRYFGSYG